MVKPLLVRSSRAKALHISMWLPSSIVFISTLNLLITQPQILTTKWTDPREIPSPSTLFDNPTSCEEIARDTPEPYTSFYRQTHRMLNMSESVWADYNWPGTIFREQFESAKSSSQYRAFKVIRNKLYRSKSDAHDGYEAVLFEESMMMALGLYEIPDADFLVDFGRVQMREDVPSMVFAFNSTGAKGFAVPGPDVVAGALGAVQMEMLGRCLDERYPAGAHRVPKGVWHGVSRPAQEGTRASCDSMAKIAGIAEDEIDFKFNVYAFSPQAQCRRWPILGESIPEGHLVPYSPVSVESDNKYKFALDLDDLGWSQHFSELAKGNTPLLKQHPPYYWSHLVKENPVDLFENDVSDFLEKLLLIHSKRFDSARLQKHAVDKMRKFSMKHFSHTGVARAVAYAVSIYASKIDWTPTLDSEYELVSPSLLYMSSLPHEFQAMLQRQNRLSWRRD